MVYIRSRRKSKASAAAMQECVRLDVTGQTRLWVLFSNVFETVLLIVIFNVEAVRKALAAINGMVGAAGSDESKSVEGERPGGGGIGHRWSR